MDKHGMRFKMKENNNSQRKNPHQFEKMKQEVRKSQILVVIRTSEAPHRIDRRS
jgi:hypothetical protein